MILLDEGKTSQEEVYSRAGESDFSKSYSVTWNNPVVYGVLPDNLSQEESVIVLSDIPMVHDEAL